jgi:hypothetical protein
MYLFHENSRLLPQLLYKDVEFFSFLLMRRRSNYGTDRINITSPQSHLPLLLLKLPILLPNSKVYKLLLAEIWTVTMTPLGLTPPAVNQQDPSDDDDINLLMI